MKMKTTTTTTTKKKKTTKKYHVVGRKNAGQDLGLVAGHAAQQEPPVLGVGQEIFLVLLLADAAVAPRFLFIRHRSNR
jgi:hypothetical protein